MKLTKSENRTNVSFSIHGLGNELTNRLNAIYAISKKHGGQDNVMSGKSAWNHDKTGTPTTPANGQAFGAVTFHSNKTPNHLEAALELVALIHSWGYHYETFQEVVKTHRTHDTFLHKAGTPYARPQTFIEKV